MSNHDRIDTAMDERQALEVQPMDEVERPEPIEELGEDSTSLPPNPTVVVKKDDQSILELTIETLPVRIGRKSDNDIVLEEKSVSRNHAQILMKEGQYVIQDLESTGGTLLNGESVTEKDIHTGDTIAVGSYRLHFDSGIPEDERTVFDTEDDTILEDGTELDEDRTLFYEEPEAKLIVIRSDSLEEDILLEEEETVFGRDEEADITVDDNRVSRQHCKITRELDVYSLIDLDSSNGTFVNGQRISEHILENGDRVQIGSSTFEFHIERPILPGQKQGSHGWVKAAVGIAAVAALAFIGLRFLKFGQTGPQKVILQKTWERAGSSAMAASLSLGDMNGDGILNIAAADVDGTVMAVDARQGGFIWNSLMKTGGNTRLTSPLLADINKRDGELDLVMATSVSVLAADGSNMRRIWKADGVGTVHGTPAAADINDDGTADIFIAEADGTVRCLDGRQGGAVWRTSLGAPIKTSPILADLNSDGKADAVIGTDDFRIHVLSGKDGRPVWIHVGTDLPSTAAVSDMNGDGISDVVIATPEQVVILEGRKGAALWRWPLPRTARPTSEDRFRPIPPAVADFNADDIPDVVVTTCGGHVYAVDGALKGGGYIWDYGISPVAKTAPALCDLNLDGTSDVVVGDRQGNLIVIDGNTGHQLNSLNVGSGIPSAPVIADFDGDGTADIAVGTEDGRIIAVETETPVGKNQIVWNSF